MTNHPKRLYRSTRFLLYAAGLALLISCGQSGDDADALATRDDGDQPAANTTDTEMPAPAASRQRSISPRQRPTSDDNGEPQTRLIRTLDDALDEVDSGDEDVDKGDLRTILHEADRELRHVLGGKSKEAILRANRKPPIRYRHELRQPAVTPEKAVTPEEDDAAAE